MTGLDERLSLQLSQAGGGGSKKVLVVEGAYDTAFLTLMLDKPPFRSKNLLAKYVIIDAGGKDAVFKALAAHKEYLGLVDRDAWTDKECERKKRQVPSLFILPRFCIENFIICPDELRQAFPEPDGFKDIDDAIQTGIRHGCLWRAAQPLYDQLMQSGFNKQLLAFPPPDDEGIAELVARWQGILSESNITGRMEAELKACGDADEGTLLRTFVHGKAFWKGVVEEKIAARFPDVSGERLKIEVFKKMAVPKDLEAFLWEVFA